MITKRTKLLDKNWRVRKYSVTYKVKQLPLLMDLFKAFDTIIHKFLVARLHAYGVKRGSLPFLINYLRHNHRRTEIESM